MKKRSAFTLIELMVVVAIIAILAAIAIPQYRKFQLKSKTSEAKMNIGAIVTAEESFAAENGQYAQCSGRPSGTPGPTKRDWGTSTNGFDLIGFRPAGKVYYTYGVRDLNNATSVPTVATAGNTMRNDATGSDFNTDTTISNTGAITNGVPVVDGKHNILIAATGDLDGDTIKAGFIRTDEETKIIPDPVDAGSNTF